MKIALIARADRTGLGYQTRALFDMLKPDRTLVIDSTPFNGNEQNFDWYYQEGLKPKYGQVSTSNGFMDDETLEWLLHDVDVVISCEVPYSDNLYRIAREKGIKTILQPNAELNPHFQDKKLDKPDYFFLPSHWLEQDTINLGVKTVYCPPPIGMYTPSTYRQRKQTGKLKVLHVAGKRAAYDRNGTKLVEAHALNIEGVEVVIADQAVNNFKDREDIYRGGYDLVLIPRRYGGLCLPALESLAHTLPVLMTDCEPNGYYCDYEWLIPAQKGNMVRTKRLIQSYTAKGRSMIDMLIKFRDMDSEEYEWHRLRAAEIYANYLDETKLWWKYLTQVVEGL